MDEEEVHRRAIAYGETDPLKVEIVSERLSARRIEKGIVVEKILRIIRIGRQQAGDREPVPNASEAGPL